jgi:hypothetical protein
VPRCSSEKLKKVKRYICLEEIVGETRGSKYGRFLAGWITQTVFESVPGQELSEYKRLFLAELKTYSFEPRKKGEARNSGCVRELDRFSDFDRSNPLNAAATIKEGLHFHYNKGTSKRILESIIENLE